MSAPIDLQLREYSEFFAARMSEITVEDIITEPVTPGPVRPLRPRAHRVRRGWAVAVATAAAVLAVVGGATWLIRAMDDGDGPADQPPTIAPAPPTTVVEPAPPPPATVSPAPDAGPEPTVPAQPEPPGTPVVEARSTEPIFPWWGPNEISASNVVGDEEGRLFALGRDGVFTSDGLYACGGGCWERFGPEGLVLEGGVAARAGGLVSVNESPADDVIRVTVVAPDGSVGETDIPVGLGPQLARVGSVGVRSFAVGGSGVVIAAETSISEEVIAGLAFGRDFEENIARTEVTGDGVFTATTTDGRTASIPLADLGIDPADYEAVSAGVMGWFSADGAEWVRIPNSGPFVAGSSVIQAVAIADGFLAFDGGGAVWYSPDGVSWTESAAQPWRDRVNPGSFHVHAVSWLGRAVVLDGVDLWALDSSSATAVDFSRAEAWVFLESPPEDIAMAILQDVSAAGTLGAGPAGIFLISTEQGVILHSAHGLEWMVQDLPDEIGGGAIAFFGSGAVAVGIEGIAVIGDGDGLSELWFGATGWTTG